ncbi:sigma-70 family RNA polymerase sigma factor [Vannielia litorea]|uniref:sigma-70 family RNA polymerase sigma factor n=1 Tax=Vannielia litorea TaxID=1217970 RepID=UPI0039657757
MMPPQNRGRNGARVETIGEETRLMLAVRDQRDRAAFAALFRRFAPRVKGLVIKGGCSPAMADEVVQEVMLRVWHKARLFDPHRAGVAAWIFTIARNARIDMLRREARPMPEELKEEPGTEPDAGQVVALEQEARKLRVALETLAPAQREAIERAYLGELTHQELSEATGLPMGTIKSRIRLGLERLRHELRGLRSPDDGQD